MCLDVAWWHLEQQTALNFTHHVELKLGLWFVYVGNEMCGVQMCVIIFVCKV